MKSVLVLEDDSAVAETIRMILEESYDVRIFDHDLQIPEGPVPALVITDLFTAGGYCSATAIRQVQHLHVRTAAPIMVLTAHGAARNDEALAHEVNAILTKPFELEELLATVDRLAV